MISLYKNRALNNTVDYLLDNFWGSYNSTIQLEEEDNQYTFKLELPGFDKSQIKITTKDNYLTIKADDGNNRVRSKSVALPQDLNTKKIKAKLKHGILYVFFPKPAAATPREILIE
jgi:HSP20 family molecular chaperone IbpA